MVAHGADVKAADDEYVTIFMDACRFMSFEFVQQLADKVPAEHVTVVEEPGIQCSPMGRAMGSNPAHRGNNST